MKFYSIKNNNFTQEHYAYKLSPSNFNKLEELYYDDNIYYQNLWIFCIENDYYEFKCEKCKKRYTKIMTISEYEKTKLRCPKCKSTRVKQQISSFQAITSKKS